MIPEKPLEEMEETRAGEASSSQASGIFGNEEQHDDAEGFETASEGSREQDDDDDVFSEDIGVHPGEVGSAPHASSGDEMERLQKELLQVGVTEEQPRTAEEKQKARLQAIDDANAAKAEGNSLYSQGAAARAQGNSSDAEGKFIEALEAYDRGLSSCPLGDPEDSGLKEIRAILHSNRAACYSNLQNNDSAVKECSKALDLNPNYLKALVRRYQAREKLTLYEEAIADVKKVLELEPGNKEAQSTLTRLVPLAEEKRENMKNEMIAKLKEAGNSLLGRFGMSIDNFKAVQDPNTGSYSIQFQR